jgi:hypothetical protein
VGRIQVDSIISKKGKVARRNITAHVFIYCDTPRHLGSGDGSGTNTANFTPEKFFSILVFEGGTVVVVAHVV